MSCCYTKQNKRIKRLERKSRLHKTRSSTNQKNNVMDVYDKCKTRQEQTDLFMSELLTCGPCGKAFRLKQNKITGSCSGCFRFLHCGIAGRCVGPNCKVFMNGVNYSQMWCVDCVPKTLLINLGERGIKKDCLCNECLNDTNTDEIYKQKI